jgi:hypothetical protein
MTDEPPSPVGKPRRKWPKRVLVLLVGIALACVVYVRTHPLIFNEAFFSHAHCIPQAAGSLSNYASDHSGRLPFHTNGYGDALLLLTPDYASWFLLTGPGGYDPNADQQWRQSGGNVPEFECGRIYVQGLTETNNPAIAILFDKVPTPGGDHCHYFKRLVAPLCRDVLLLDGSREVIRESKWPEFASNQIELLVKEGYDRTAAEQLYAEKGKER